MSENLRPTPETDAALANRNSSVAVDAAFARNLERQRDEAREKLETEKEARKAFAAVHRKCSDDKSALEKQRDRLLEALEKAVAAHAFDAAWKPAARAAIAEVKGGR